MLTEMWSSLIIYCLLGCVCDYLNHTDNNNSDTAHYELVNCLDEIEKVFDDICFCMPDEPHPNLTSVNGQLNTIILTRRGTSVEFHCQGLSRPSLT